MGMGRDITIYEDEIPDVKSMSVLHSFEILIYVTKKNIYKRNKVLVSAIWRLWLCYLILNEQCNIEILLHLFSSKLFVDIKNSNSYKFKFDHKEMLNLFRHKFKIVYIKLKCVHMKK